MCIYKKVNLVSREGIMEFHVEQWKSKINHLNDARRVRNCNLIQK